MKILYLHGFASSPAGRKIAALRGILEPAGDDIVAPDLNVPSFEELDFESMVRVALDGADRLAPAVVVGSSLGAVVALEAARRRARSPLVLIAPAIGFGPRWMEKLPPGDPLVFFHHATLKETPIHRRFFEELAANTADRETPSVPTSAVIGTQDESVPFEHVRRVWEEWQSSGRLPAGSRFVAVEGGDHGLVDHVAIVAGEIRRLASLRPPN